jgi:hypothetical protein
MPKTPNASNFLKHLFASFNTVVVLFDLLKKKTNP